MTRFLMRATVLVSLLFALILCLPPAENAMAEDTPTPVSDFRYTIQNDEIYIQSYLGTAAYVNVPQFIEGKPVVSVSLSYYLNGSIVYNRSVKKVVLPETVRELPARAFTAFLALQEIEGLENIHSVEECFVSQCPINTLRFSDNLEYIGYDAFNGAMVNKLVIPDDVVVYAYEDNEMQGFQGLTAQEIELIRGSSPQTLCMHEGLLYTADLRSLINVPTNKANERIVIPSSTERILRWSFPTIVNGRYEIEIPASVTFVHPDSLKIGMRAVVFVHPQSAGLDYAQNVLAQVGETYIPFEYYIIGQDEYVPYEDRLAELVDSIVDESMSDYAKALALHDWIIANIIYDYDSSSGYYTPEDS